MKLKLKISRKSLAAINKCLIMLMVGKMKDETAGVAIEKYGGFKPKMYSYLVDDNSEDKKAKDVNKNVVVTKIHNEYKDILLNKTCLRHSMNSI